ncbi:hypothetical protein IWQ56_006293, partial [Coemansia nantahalensis]
TKSDATRTLVKAFSIVTKNIVPFAGDTKKQPLEPWLRHLESLLTTVCLARADWARVVPMVFSTELMDQVLTGIGFDGDTVPSWDTVRKHLFACFGRVSTVYDKVTDFETLVCGDDINAFNSSFSRLALELKIADREVLGAWYLFKLPLYLREQVQGLRLDNVGLMQERATFLFKLRRDMQQQQQQQDANADDMRMDIDRVEAKSKPKPLPRQQWLDDYAPFVARERFKKNVRDGRCGHCGFKGHVIAECRKLKAKREASSRAAKVEVVYSDSDSDSSGNGQ